jgi:hypothetical protein
MRGPRGWASSPREHRNQPRQQLLVALARRQQLLAHAGLDRADTFSV